MYKILLIDDRTYRQNNYLNILGLDLSEYSDIVDNCIDDKYNDIVNNLNDDSFDFESYSVIISHKSAFGDNNTKLISKLEKYCKKSNKILVLFSGGIDTNYYFKENGFEHIELNSKVFYSQNLKLFLDMVSDNIMQPLILNYGIHWSLDITLNVLEKINLFIESSSESKVLYKIFIESCQFDILDNLDMDLYTPSLDGKYISLDEVTKIKDDIYLHIQQRLTYE
ncbi:MAG: hypothetical protein DRQ78_05425 [Epsilonproteobacteria bacterium]|nr:MAG: hypothetical protein DRQ78_05425 [Campylobacterota bacterium]